MSNAIKDEVVFYEDDSMRIEGAVFYDSVSDSYIASIEIIENGGSSRIEVFNKEYIDLKYAKKAIRRNYRKKIKNINRRYSNEKEDD